MAHAQEPSYRQFLNDVMEHAAHPHKHTDVFQRDGQVIFTFEGNITLAYDAAWFHAADPYARLFKIREDLDHGRLLAHQPHD